MPRLTRSSAGNQIYYVHTRTSESDPGFREAADYLAMTDFISRTGEKVPMRVLAGCMVPTELHLLLWPYRDGDLSRWMTGLMTRHVRRHRRLYGGEGRVWQRRFDCFPVENGPGLIDLVKWIEQLPVRTGIAERVMDWPWGSFGIRMAGDPHHFLEPLPTELPADWQVAFEEGPDEHLRKQIEYCLKRGAPFGRENWVTETVERLGLQKTINPRGRPRKKRKPSD